MGVTMLQNLDLISFESAPTDSIAVVEAYDESSVSALTKARESGEVSGGSVTGAVTALKGDLSPTQVVDLANDNELMKFADDSFGGDLAKAVKSVMSSLPSSVTNLGDVMDKSGMAIMDIHENVKRLKDASSISDFQSIGGDLLSKTLSFSNTLTNSLSPLGDYFCKKNTSSIFGGFDVDLSFDLGIRASLDAAKGALASANGCGFDAVGFLGGLDYDEGLISSIGAAIMGDSASSGSLGSVANLSTFLDGKVSSGILVDTATNLASNFVPGTEDFTSFGDTESNVFVDTMSDLVPEFSLEGNTVRMDMLTAMGQPALDMLSKDDRFFGDAGLASLSRDTAAVEFSNYA